MSFTESRIRELLDSFAGKHIAVIGDVMLDRYYRGSVSRISPEAPVPVVDIEEESEYPGGAANVGYNLVRLGARPLLLGIAGNDFSGEQLRSLLSQLGIGSEGIVSEPNRPTTVKTRVIAASQHIVRADRESKGMVSDATRDHLLNILEEQIESLDALIFQDYNKGVISADLINQAVTLAQKHSVPTYVDPKFENFFDYKNVTVFKPNRKEASDALQRPLKSKDEAHDASQELLNRLGSDYVVLTLGSEGMMLAQRNAEPFLVPTRAIQVADVSGAGDTVIATLATARAAGATIHEAIIIANHAAGVVCEQIGTVPIQHNELLAALLEDYGKEPATANAPASP